MILISLFYFQQQIFRRKLIYSIDPHLICLQCRRLGLISGLGRSPGEEKGYPPSILAWRIPWTTVHGVAKSQTQLSHFHFHFLLSKWPLPKLSGIISTIGCYKLCWKLLLFMLLPSMAGITISSSVVNITMLPSFTCVFLALQLRRFHSSGILLTFFFFFFFFFMCLDTLRYFIGLLK